jgi:protein O-GlcNAc transferase
VSAVEAVKLWRSGRHRESERLCVELAARDDTEALSLLAEIYTGTGRSHEAVESLRRLATLRPADAGVHRRLGNALLAVRSFAESVSSYQDSLRIEPRNARGHNNLGQALMHLGRIPDAAESYERAIEAEPNYAIAHNNLGITRYEEGAWEEAVACYRRALELEPSFAEARNNCGNALMKMGQPQEALEQYDLAVAARPDLADAHNNRGRALLRLCRYEDAIEASEMALQLKPDDVKTLINLAAIMMACEQFDEVIGYCDRAIALDPHMADAYEQRGSALMGARRHEEAVGSFRKFFELEPQRRFAAGTVLNARLACCDWADYTATRDELIQSVQADRPAVMPFTFLSLCDSPELQLKCARAFVADQIPGTRRQPWSGARHSHERLRVGYLSADFRQHATAILMAGLFEAHDRQRFATVAFSFGLGDGGLMQQRLQRSFDRFIDVRGQSESDVVKLMRSLEIDIAVDLKGYTWDMRPGILSRRCAPVQVSYLGYPGTLGLEEVDYLIADPIVLPPRAARHCVEKIVYLPDCYQVNDDKRPLGEAPPSRAEAGLPQDAFVFCCFNNNYKIVPQMYDIWMRLLHAVPGSVLWLLEDNAAAGRNLRREAGLRGISAERIVFAPRVSPEGHLARQRLADLFLDTLPYNAHTTCSDALWAGLPVLTCMGATFPARVAASLLHAVGLPELVTHSLDEYFGRALALASSPEQLESLRTRLARNRTTYPLFATKRFCRHLELAYVTMWQRHEEGLPPESFSVSPLVMET